MWRCVTSLELVLFFVICLIPTTAAIIFTWNGKSISSVSDIPGGIPLSTTRLELKYNNLQSIGDAQFSNLTKLKTFQAYHNRLEHLAGSALCGTLLENLILRSNKLKRIPDLSCVATTLKYLNLRENQIKVLSHLPLEVLSTLDLEENEISEVHGQALNQTQSMTKLSLHRNYLRTMPDFSYIVGNMEYIWISENNLVEIPDNCLPRVQKLGLGENDIANISEAAFNNTYLEYLHLNSNNLKGFPEALLMVKGSIKEIFMQANPLEEIDEFILNNLTSNSLRILKFDNIEHLKKLPKITECKHNLDCYFDSTGVTESLDMSYVGSCCHVLFYRYNSPLAVPQFPSLPPNSRLKKLDLNSNKYIDADIFLNANWSSAGNMMPGSELILQNCGFKAFPYIPYEARKRISYFDVQSNYISFIEEDRLAEWEALRTLLLYNNKLTEIPPLFANITLERLDLNQNIDITNFSNIASTNCDGFSIHNLVISRTSTDATDILSWKECLCKSDVSVTISAEHVSFSADECNGAIRKLACIDYECGITFNWAGSSDIPCGKSSWHSITHPTCLAIITSPTMSAPHLGLRKSSTMCTVDLENDMSCCLCSEEFNTYDRHAKLLPCGDTFCFVCIVHLHEGTGLKSITCPYCCEYMELDSEEVHGLPEDQHIMCFVEHRVLGNSRSNKAVCERHREEATLICWTCKQVLCDKCRQEEERKEGKDRHVKHDVEDLRQLFEDAVRDLRKYMDLEGVVTNMSYEAGIIFQRRTADLRERMKVIMRSLERKHIHAIADAKNILQELHGWERICQIEAVTGGNGQVHADNRNNDTDNQANHELQKAIDLKVKRKCIIQ